jgi:hypothetical protein
LEKDIFFLVYRKVTFGGGSIRTKEEFIGKKNLLDGWLKMFKSKTRQWDGI